MDFKEIKGKKHFLYESIFEFNLHHPDITARKDWRNAKEGDWIETSDGYVCQNLKSFKIQNTKCIRTVLGSFNTKSKTPILGKKGIADRIYTFNGKDQLDTCSKSKQKLFAKYVALGKDVVSAYKEVFPNAKNESYIRNRSNSLMKMENVQDMVKKEIQEILEEEGVTHAYIIQRMKDIADLAEQDNIKLRSLESLAKISGLFSTEETKKETLTVWGGISPKLTQELEDDTKKAELLAHGEQESSPK
jgi:SpoVK/Ycf46/Vps4 family AAA+-type ATPase